MKTFALLLLLLGHGLTQIGISIPDQTWRQWMQNSSPQTLATCTFLLFAIRLAADLGLCWWIIGPERRKLAWTSVRAWILRQKSSEEIEKTHAT